ncbi:MAG: hypothetical protein WBJ41_03755, partial [Chromatiaceae bacterium]
KARAGESLVAPDLPHQYHLPEGMRYEHGGRGLIPGEPALPAPTPGLPPATGGPPGAVAPPTNPAFSPPQPLAPSGPTAPPAPSAASPFPGNPLETLNRKGGI